MKDYRNEAGSGVLMDQAYFRDDSKKSQDLVHTTAKKIGQGLIRILQMAYLAIIFGCGFGPIILGLIMTIVAGVELTYHGGCKVLSFYEIVPPCPTWFESSILRILE